MRSASSTPLSCRGKESGRADVGPPIHALRQLHAIFLQGQGKWEGGCGPTYQALTAARLLLLLLQGRAQRVPRHSPAAAKVGVGAGGCFGWECCSSVPLPWSEVSRAVIEGQQALYWPHP